MPACYTRTHARARAPREHTRTQQPHTHTDTRAPCEHTRTHTHRATHTHRRAHPPSRKRGPERAPLSRSQRRPPPAASPPPSPRRPAMPASRTPGCGAAAQRHPGGGPATPSGRGSSPIRPDQPPRRRADASLRPTLRAAMLSWEAGQPGRRGVLGGGALLGLAPLLRSPGPGARPGWCSTGRTVPRALLRGALPDGGVRPEAAQGVRRPSPRRAWTS